MISTCEAADPHPRKPNSKVPAGAVDCHAHIFGPYEKYPLAAGRTYTPPEASLRSYLHLLDTLGVDRAVLVQPSVYGFDNRCMINALNTVGNRFRGVAVVAADCDNEELERLHAAGVRGIRINVVFGGGAALDAAKLLAKRIERLGWHLQFLVNVSKIDELAQLVRNISVPVVIDHFGHVDASLALRSNGFLQLLALVHAEKCWVKLSGPYRITKQSAAPYGDVSSIARALIDAGPTRCVWATDWPHPAIGVPMPNDGDLVDQLASWINDEDICNMVFRDNAVKLYGFT